MSLLSSEQIHKTMAAIHSKDTKPEMIVRKGLWSRGFRYRLNHKRLPGHPDLVLRKYRTCIFVNGCFWHGHNVVMPTRFLDCARNDREGEEAVREGEETERGEEDMKSSECCKIPKSNREFWVAKILRNKERDKEDQKRLAAMGWHCITVWECELKPKVREQTLDSLAYTLNHIWMQDHQVVTASYQPTEEENSMSMAAEERDIVLNN